MTTLTGQHTRTIAGYLMQLLEYPRWFIDREVDFTECRHFGRYDDELGECAECRFGEACQWLNQKRLPLTDVGGVDELIVALQTAVEFVQVRTNHDKRCRCDSCRWLLEARQFLHSRNA